MPVRNISCESAVLRARESPGGTRIVTLLAADQGLLDVFVFGGPKSRLRSLASPYHAGTAWIYRDPVKELLKLSDFDARQTFPTLRENLRKLWSASYFAESLLRTDAAGGESRAAYALLQDGLEALDAGNESSVDYITLQFGWRLLALMGQRPNPSECAHCGAAFPDGEGALFSRAQSVFLCPSCAGAPGEAGPGLIPVSPGALRYLSSTAGLSFQDALRSAVSPDDLSRLKAVIFHMVRSSAEGELRTLERGELL